MGNQKTAHSVEIFEATRDRLLLMHCRDCSLQLGPGLFCKVSREFWLGCRKYGLFMFCSEYLRGYESI